MSIIVFLILGVLALWLMWALRYFVLLTGVLMVLFGLGRFIQLVATGN